MKPVAKPLPPRMHRLLARAALVINTSLGVGYAALWLMLAAQGQFWRADFSAYYAGWSIVRDGQSAHLYDLDVQARYQRQILDEGEFQGGVLPYLNPPYATLPFVPLAWLARPAAFWLWSLGQAVLLAWLLRLLLRIAHGWSTRERWLLLSGVVAFPPLMFTFMLGTFSLLILVCLLRYSCALKHNQERRAALWLVLGTVKPQLMVLPGVVLAGARRWRALAAVLLAGGVLVVLSGLLMGWQSWAGFARLLQTVNNIYGDIGIVPTVMYNIKGTLALLLGNEQGALINQISLVLFGAAAIVALLVWRGAWQPGNARFELHMAFTLVMGLLFLPHLNPHDGLLLVAPATLFYLYLRQRSLPRTGYAAFALGCPLFFLVSEFTVGGSLGIRGPVVAMLILLVWIGIYVYREQRSGDTQLCANA